MVHLTVLFKTLETCPPASHAKQLLDGMQQNKHQNKSHAQSVMCLKMLCNILTRMLNQDYFQSKQLLQTESCTVQSVEVCSQSSRIAILSQMSRVLSDISCQIEWCLLHKECYYLKILISKW